MAAGGAVGRLFANETLVALLALVLGAVLVCLYDAALESSRYPYSGDSASYIEMARTLASEGRPLVTPWELTPADRDLVPQPLFPPGFAVLVAALVPVAGDARDAALWPSRIGALLLPLLLVLRWRGLASPAVLLGVGIWVLVSPGVREWHFLAYSDVAALALAVAALGTLAGGLAGPRPAADTGTATWLVAGLLAGICYTVRNAGLAVLGAALATLLYARLRGFVGTRPLVWFGAGAALPLAALFAYDRATFGTLWPYSMPPSVRPWSLNALDLGRAQLEDAGLPGVLAEQAPGLLPLALLLLLLGLGAFAWWRTRDSRRLHTWLTLLGAYVAGGGVLLVLSRSRFEWGNFIDPRNTLQYSFALVLAVVVGARVLLPGRARRLLGPVLIACLVLRVGYAGFEAFSERRSPAASWLALDRDARVMDAARAIPPATLVASNAAVLFRIGGPRAARQLDVGGEDGDFEGSLAVLAQAAGPRPAAFLLVCNEWTWKFAACRAGAAPGGPDCRRLRSLPPVVAECRVGRAPLAPTGGTAGAPIAPAGS